MFVLLENEKEVVEIDMIIKFVKLLFLIVCICLGILWMNDKFIIVSGDKIELYGYDGIR